MIKYTYVHVYVYIMAFGIPYVLEYCTYIGKKKTSKIIY